MKRLIYILNIIGLIFIVNITSCSDDFLDTAAPTEVMDNFFTSQEKAQLAVVGCYDVAGWFEDNALPFFFGDIIGRDAWKGGDVGADQDWMDNLINFTYTTDNYILNTAWKNYYVGINRCNSAIQNISKMPTTIISTNKKNQFISEVRFMRGYYYFELVKTFGSVPLVDHPLAPSEYQQPLVAESTVWSFIENDFAYAGKHLPVVGTLEAGRATKGAADAYRAKAYIYQKKWQQAKDLTDSIIASGQYSLLPNYADVFKKSNEHNSEIIFSIEFKSTTDANAYGNESEGSSLIVFITPRDYPYAGLGGYGFDCPKQDLVDEFESGDSRMEATVIHNGETLWAGTADSSTYDINWSTSVDHYANQKYAVPPSLQPASPYDAGKNWIVIRYADVLLWNSEAAYHVSGDWETSLQKVRTRAGLGQTPYHDDPIKAIYHERRVELGMEGHRFWDVVRQGRGAEVYGQYGYVEGVNNHFPIAQDQLDLSNIW